MAPLSPTVASWELTSRIRQRVADLGLTGAMIAKHLNVTAAYWSKVDRERKVLSETKLQLLLEILDLPKKEGKELLDLRTASKEQGWWAKFPTLFNAEAERLWGLEYGASELSCHSCILVPGLLQTANYAKALFGGDEVFIPKKEVSRRVEARMIRQQRLSGPEPLKVNAVISEAVLHQEIGGPAVHQEQLQHLANLVREKPDMIDLRIMPFTCPKGFITGGTAYYIIEFDRPHLPTLVWRESGTTSGIIEDMNVVRDLTVDFETAQNHALSPTDTLSRIESAID